MVGGGPAGRAVAAACAARGLRTALLDPAPERPWRATYGAWSGELPAGLPDGLVAARACSRVVALTEHRLSWEYAVLDVPALRRHLDGELERAGVAIRVGRAAGPPGPDGVPLHGGGRARARLVIDAGGHRQPLHNCAGTGREPWHRGADADRSLPRGAGPGRPPAEQTAFGLVLPAETAAGLVGPGEALFMDWRTDHGGTGWPTFLYAVPLGGGKVLLEETSLARRPGLPLPVLRARLHARLTHHGISPVDTSRDERVRFPLDRVRYSTGTAVGFGAAAPLVHPATGFSVATALGLAPRVADALATWLPRSPDTARAAARAVVWPRTARMVHLLRRRGLEALLAMPPEQVPAFFEMFFTLPERHRWAYLTGRDDLTGTCAALRALFGRADWILRCRLVAPALLLPPRPLR